jgi:GDP-mannose 6-dehydrogenase
MKVAFANEIGAVSQQFAIDGRKVMDIFCEDGDLNISRRYLRPGFGFGGSCLPKDLRALMYAAKERDVLTPLLGSVMNSNDAHIQRVVDAVLDTGKRQVALLGLSFKPSSDDLRESPFVRLAEALIGKGIALRVCDPDVALDSVFGRNRAYIDTHVPHLAQLLAGDWQEVVRGADVVIIGKVLPNLDGLPGTLRADQVVIDLVGIDLPGPVQRPWSAASQAAALPA